MKTYIFDIDGTIANTEHRQHFIRHRPYNWESWFAVAHKDVPYWEIVDLMEISHNAAYLPFLRPKFEISKEHRHEVC